MKMMWAGLAFFPGNIYNFAIAGNKDEIPKIGPNGFLWPQGVDKILRFCSWHGLSYLINVEENASDACFLARQ